MCIFVLALDTLPDFPFILIFNRDEYFTRPTTPPRILEDGLLCAIDQEKGGTWMGLNTHTGAFAALTNVRCAAPAGLESRGQLVRRYLLGDTGQLSSSRYASFNLLTGALDGNSGAHNLKLSASTPEDLSNDGPWKPATYAVKHSGQSEVLAKSNDATGRLVSASDSGEENWPKAVWLRAEIARLLSALPKDLSAKEGAEAVLQALEPAACAAELPQEYAALAASYRTRWTNLQPAQEEVRL